MGKKGRPTKMTELEVSPLEPVDPTLPAWERELLIHALTKLARTADEEVPADARAE